MATGGLGAGGLGAGGVGAGGLGLGTLGLPQLEGMHPTVTHPAPIIIYIVGIRLVKGHKID